MQSVVDYAIHTNPISVNGKKSEFLTTTEHVGMLRASSGNHLTILARFTAHNKALGGVLHTGMALEHRGNPTASLHINNVYCNPVLLSCLAPLFLSKTELTMIGHQSLLPCTPTSVVLFLGGSMPDETLALLHL